jgi:DNA-binding MarR family transcriptional regulator
MSATRALQPLPLLEDFLTYRLHVLNKLTDRESHRTYIEACGMPLGEARCLAAIGRFEPLSVNDLARAANLDKGHASRSAHSLVEDGLIIKQASELDGRGVVLSTTPIGKTRYRTLIALIDQRNQDIFGCLNPEEQQTLKRMLDRVIAAQRNHER